MKRTGRIHSVLNKGINGIALPWDKVKEDLCECTHYQSLCQKFRQRK